MAENANENARSFGWCFLGAGSIVRRVMPEMHKTDGGFLASVYAPTFAHAEEVTKKYGGQACRTAKEALSAPGVKAAYIATPHTAHMESALLALEMGIPVLCEKPFAINHAQALAMIDGAKSRGLYIAEGMWTRHNPVFSRVLEWIKDGRIGRPRSLVANMAARAKEDPAARVFDINRGGGALLDIGVYAIAASEFVFGGNPVKISAMGELSPHGTDRMCAMQLQYADGGIARLFTGFAVGGGFDAVVHGERGDIIVPGFAAPRSAKLTADDGEESFAPEIFNEGFAYEFDAAMGDISAGRLENALVPHGYTLEVMRIMDEVRRQIGLRYPME